jgi:hypothetical protein
VALPIYLPGVTLQNGMTWLSDYAALVANVFGSFLTKFTTTSSATSPPVASKVRHRPDKTGAVVE